MWPPGTGSGGDRVAGVEVLDGWRLEQEAPGAVNRLDGSQGRVVGG